MEQRFDEYCKKLDEYSKMYMAAWLSYPRDVVRRDVPLSEICRIALDYADILIEMQEERKKSKQSS